MNKETVIKNGKIIELGTKLTDDLVYEGIANDIRHIIQNLRKDSGLNITDKIYFGFYGPYGDKIKERYLEYIGNDVLGEYKEIGTFNKILGGYFTINNDNYGIIIGAS